MDAATFVARYLKAAGVKRAFGLPGGEVLALLEAMRQSGIEVVLAHHEAEAAFMAEVTGHLTGVPGVCFSTFGPGATNLLTGIASAFLDRVPMIAFSGDYSRTNKQRMTHQHLDLPAIYGPVTHMVGELYADNVLEKLPQAVAAATGGSPAGPPGPVHFATANEEMKLPLADSATAERLLDQPRVLWASVSGSNRLDSAARLINASQRPVMLAGIQVDQYGAYQDVRDLAEWLNTPVLTTPQAKGAFSEDHPLFAGTFGVFGQPALDGLLAEADLVVMIGADGVDFIPPWTAAAPILSITGTSERKRTFQPVLELARAPLRLHDVTELCLPKEAWIELDALRERVGASIHLPADRSRLSPQTVLEVLREALPADGILSCDVGSHKLQACQQWPALGPKSFLVTNGLSSMGYAIPAALAAKLETPNQPVAALLGDGGLLMYTGELETVARLGLPIVMVVLVDDSLSLIRLKQERESIPTHAVNFGRVDYAGLARDFGLRGFRCGTPMELAAHLDGALHAQVATLLEVPIDIAWYRPPAGHAALDVA